MTAIALRLPAAFVKWRPYIFTFTPLVVTLAIADIQGVLYRSRCGPLRTLQLMFGSVASGHRCETITVIADLPSLTLGFTATVAAWLYWQSEARWRRLADDLTANGVLL
jgi:hypothetical protein